MCERSLATALRRLAVEIFLFTGVACAFLSAYLRTANGSLSSVGAHLGLLGTTWGLLLCIRLALWGWTGRVIARWVSATLVASLLTVMMVYYALVLVGLSSWGRVASWTLIHTYAAEIPGLANSLGVPLAPLALGLALLFFLLIWAADRSLLRPDGAAVLSHFIRRRLLGLLVVAGIGLVAVYFYNFSQTPPVPQREPVSLTFFASHIKVKRQAHSTDASRQRELATAADRASYVPNPDAHRRNVIIITVDALRPDHMGVYGYERSTTPYLSSLLMAGRLHRIDRMVSVCAESYCGLLSIARSKYVHELSADDFSLAEVLRRHGYRIELLLGGDHTNFYGLRDAYGAVDHYADGADAQEHGYSCNDDRLVLSRVGSLQSWDGRPTMLQLHLMSAHPLGVRDPAHERYVPAASYASPKVRLMSEEAARQRVVNYYDNGVLQADDAIRVALAHLKDKGFLRDAIVVVTADHGDSLGEHDEFGHSKGVFEPALRVPFMLIDFGTAAMTAMRPRLLASTVDIAPTLLESMAMPLPKSWSGIPLQHADARHYLFFQQAQQVGLYDLREQSLLKFWRRVGSDEFMSFDLRSDPGETRNLWPSVSTDVRTQWQGALLNAVSAVD